MVSGLGQPGLTDCAASLQCIFIGLQVTYNFISEL
jgi:hypothetical protein